MRGLLVEGGRIYAMTSSGGTRVWPSYGAVFFEPNPDAAVVLGLDLGARFLRGAICDLYGEIRARQDVEITGVDAETVIDAIDALRGALIRSADLSPELVDGVVVGVPGVVSGFSGHVRLATNVPGLEDRDFGSDLRARLALPLTVENDINLAALGEQWRGVARGVDDFVFLSIGTGLGAGLVLRGELHPGRHGAAGELDYTRAGRGEQDDPCAGAVSALAEQLSAGADTVLEPPYDVRTIFAAARGGDAVARVVVEEEARRIALHVVPVAAVADVALVVLGGGIGANGDLLLGPVRSLLAEWLPYPPRVEVSSLGETAVLTGALSVGVHSARENVFANRARR